MEVKMVEQDRTPLLDGIKELIATNPAYFRIPGHRGISPGWVQGTGTGIFAYDVTETPLTDDLHNPRGVIRRAQELLAGLYGADKSFFLVNGSTCGNEAMIMSAAGEGDQIMIARNAHKSAMMGLILSGAEPVYVMPEIDTEWGLQGGVTPQAVRNCFVEHPGCKALFMVSPTYYGVCSDLKAVAEVCHEYGALLLVDEAHGGHVYFHDRLPEGALAAGADMCVQSMHKVTGALTQSSVLHIKYHGTGCGAFERIARNLQLVQSTSPSYLLMASIDCARHELAMHGTAMMEQALRLAGRARDAVNAIPGFRCMGDQIKGSAGIKELDTTRLVISAAGLTGYTLEALLFERYAVNMELADSRNVLAIVTCANRQEDMDRLAAACEDISKERGGHAGGEAGDSSFAFPHLPEQVMTPRRAYFAKAAIIGWQEAVGRISGQMLAPYPPGIPVIYPGERISREIWECIEGFRRAGRPMHGTDEEGRLDKIKIIEELQR